MPRFVVFYNGTDVQPDRQTLRGLPVLFLFVYFFCFSGILCSDTPRGIRWLGRKGAHHERYCQFQLHRLRSVRQHLSGGLEIGDDGLAQPIQEVTETLEKTASQARESCPVNAIDLE